MTERLFEIGQEVKVWAGLTLMGYPDRGTVRRYIPDYPGGPSYEVEFPPNDLTPFACLKPEWLFPVAPAPSRPSESVR